MPVRSMWVISTALVLSRDNLRRACCLKFTVSWPCFKRMSLNRLMISPVKAPDMPAKAMCTMNSTHEWCTNTLRFQRRLSHQSSYFLGGWHEPKLVCTWTLQCHLIIKHMHSICQLSSGEGISYCKPSHRNIECAKDLNAWSLERRKIFLCHLKVHKNGGHCMFN